MIKLIEISVNKSYLAWSLWSLKNLNIPILFCTSQRRRPIKKISQSILLSHFKPIYRSHLSHLLILFNFYLIAIVFSVKKFKQKLYKPDRCFLAVMYNFLKPHFSLLFSQISKVQVYFSLFSAKTFLVKS